MEAFNTEILRSSSHRTPYSEMYCTVLSVQCGVLYCNQASGEQKGAKSPTCRMGESVEAVFPYYASRFSDRGTKIQY